MKRISLTQGQFALVDDVDFEELSKHKWYAHKTRYGGYTAVRHVRCPETKKQRTIHMHRQLMNALKGLQIDHINHDTLDNQRANLRLCTRSQNLMNSHSQRGSASRWKGVSWYKPSRKWHAQIKFDGKSRHLGYFVREAEAAKAYDRAARKHFGEFALLNFPKKMSESIIPRTKGGLATGLLCVLILVGLMGCQIEPTMTEAKWREQYVPADVNEAKAMITLEKAKAETQAKVEQAKQAMTQKSLCFWGMVLAVVALAIGITLTGLKVLQIPAGAALVACGFGWGISLAEIRFPAILAYGGLALSGIIVVGAVFLAAKGVKVLVERLFTKEKALKEVVLSVEKAKARDVDVDYAMKEVKKKNKIQTQTTETIVDEIRKEVK